MRWLVIGAGAALLAGAGPLPSALAIVTSSDRSVFVDVTPRRIADTRIDVGITNPVPSGVPKVLQVTGNVAIAPSGSATVVPTGATGVVLNVTAVNPTRSGFVSVRPGNPGGAPTTSNLNVEAGVTIPNQVTVGLPVGGGNDGRVQVWFQGTGGGATDILVDVVGYYDDHRHDDRYYREAETRQLILENQVLIGAIDATGSKLGLGPFTSSRSGIGRYTVSYSLVGAGIPISSMPPIMTVTPNVLCPGVRIAMGGWTSWSGIPGGEASFMAFEIETYSDAGTAVDCATQFHIGFAHAGVEITEPGALGTSVQAAGQAVECRNTEEGAVCETLD